MQELIDEDHHGLELIWLDLEFAIESVHLEDEHKVHSELTTFDNDLLKLGDRR